MPEWFVKGGFVMWPLLVCSVTGVAIIIERVWALQRKRIISPAVATAIEKQPDPDNSTEQVRELCDKDDSILSQLSRATLAHSSMHKAENVEAVQAVARQIVSRMERGLTTLSLIVEISPLLGLLGTVTGMVRLFTDVAQHGLGEPAAISRGIFEALITTVTGLVIAIPTLVAYMYLRRRIETLVLELERHTNELLARIYK